MTQVKPINLSISTVRDIRYCIEVDTAENVKKPERVYQLVDIRMNRTKDAKERMVNSGIRHELG